MQFKAEIHITLKPTVNDPQGLTIRGGLHALGYKAVETVRAGKYIEIWLEADSATEAQSQANEMSDQLLANPVIEDYKVSIIHPSPSEGDVPSIPLSSSS